MNCAEIRRVLNAYLDAELDISHELAVEQHLQTCQACARMYTSYQTLRAAFQAHPLYFPAPAELRLHVLRDLPQNRVSPRIARLRSWPWLGAAALLLLLLGGLCFWLLGGLRSAPADENHMALAVVNSHERSLVSNRLVDLPTSDPVALKTWLESRLGFSPPVINLTLQGYTLIGGRLDFLENHSVAAIVYKRDQHIINLFIWPASQSVSQSTLSLQGYYLTHWTNYGMNCWAITDMSEGQLQHFASLIDQHLETYLSSA